MTLERLWAGWRAAYIGGCVAISGDHRASIHAVGLTAFIGYTLGMYPMSIWYHRKWSTTFKMTFDALVYAAAPDLIQVGGQAGQLLAEFGEALVGQRGESVDDFEVVAVVAADALRRLDGAPSCERREAREQALLLRERHVQVRTLPLLK